MKAFLDHYGYRWIVHRPEEKMFSKQAVCISTAAGAGMKSTNKDMADSMFFWGIGRTYKYGVAVTAVSWDGVKDKIKMRIDRKTSVISDKSDILPYLKRQGLPLVNASSRFSFDSTNVLSISGLTPYVLRFFILAMQ